MRVDGRVKGQRLRHLRGIIAVKNEYDFSKAQRGKFYRADSILGPPIHLEPEVLAYLTARAEARGVSLSELVNTLLKKDIELIGGRITRRA